MKNSAVLLACALGAWVAYDLYHSVRTGRARGKFGTITRRGRPKSFRNYIIGDVDSSSPSGLIIPLGLGVLSAIELRNPSLGALAFVQTRAEPRADISYSHEARITKVDHLEGASVSSEMPQQAVLVGEGIASPEDIKLDFSELPRPIAHHRHNSKSRKVKVTTAARPKSEQKAAVKKRAAMSQLPNAPSDAEPCRLKAFGGLRKALNSVDCEI